MRESRIIPNGNLLKWDDWDKQLLLIGQRCEKLLFGYCGIYKDPPAVFNNHSIIKWVFNPYWDCYEDNICSTEAKFFCFGYYQLENKNSMCLN